MLASVRRTLAREGVRGGEEEERVEEEEERGEEGERGAEGRMWEEWGGKR